MRKNAKSWIIKVLFGIIVVVFVFFYGFSDLRKSKETALASIGEKKITVSEYQEAYKTMLQFYRNIYQGQLSEEMIKQMGLKQKALENLIDREIMLQEADRMKLYAAPGEISRNIMQSQVFQEKGVFSQALYERALRYYGISVADFEKNQERELIIKKLEDIVKSGVKVSDKELKEQFLVENEKIKIDYVCFNPETIKDSLPVSEQEIEGYYKKHSEEFRKPETAKAQYIVVSPQDYENKAVVSDKDIKEYYQTDIERFSEPKKIKARHILLKVGKGDASEKEQAIRKRAEELLQKLKNGEDFAKLAEKNSEDTVSAKKGGDLGFFKKGDMVKPFEEAAFSLKTGELSPLIRTTHGFHIIRVDDMKEAYTKSFDEAKPVLEKELKQEEAKKIARDEANRAYNRLFKSKDLQGFAKQNSLNVLETDYFTYGKGPEDTGQKNSFSEAAFSLAAGELAPVVSLGQNYVLLKLVGKKESHIPPLQEAKETIRTTIEKEKKVALAKERAEKLASRLKDGSGDWAALAKENNLEIKTSAEFTRRGEIIPEIGKTSALKEAAFTLSEKKLYAGTVFQTEKGSFVVKFRERQVPGQEEYQKKREQLERQLVQMKKEEVFNRFLESLKAKADIKVNKKLIASD